MVKKSDRKQIGSLIDESIYRQAKAQAALENRPVGEIIDDALRAYLKAKGKIGVDRGKPLARTKP